MAGSLPRREEEQDAERRRLHKVIERLVPWEASNDERILNEARWEIARSVAWGLGEEPPPQGDGAAILDYLQTKAPPVYDPFSGGGSIPLEAQRLGLRAYGSDLNPVAVLIGKALVEIPPKFAGRPPVNPKSRAEAMNGELRGMARARRASRRTCATTANGCATRPKNALAISIRRRNCRTVPRRRSSPGCGRARCARPIRRPRARWCRSSRPSCSRPRRARKAWVEPVIDAAAPDGWRFEVRDGALSKAEERCAPKARSPAERLFRCF